MTVSDPAPPPGLRKEGGRPGAPARCCRLRSLIMGYPQSRQGKAKNMRCEHEICTCVTTDGETVCSEACASASDHGDFCPCGHDVCENSGRLDPPAVLPPK